jgi:hypothetical protein
MKYYSLSVIFVLSFYIESRAQCFSSLNPVAGISNLLVLEKNTVKFICSYNYGLMDEYFEGHKRTDYTLVKRADYNYVAAVLAYGIFNRLTLESEAGYFLNKTYHFENATSKGYGFNNIVISPKFSLVTNHDKRFYCSGSIGIKVPLSMELQKVDLVEVPHELQPSTHAFGYVLQGFMVKENSFRGLRYFLVARGEYNHKNSAGYRYGNFFSTSAYLSKHLMYNWLKRDLTTILQLRNEFRGRDRLDKDIVEYTGGYSLLLIPQVNLTIKERWNISVLGKIPVYQYFNGTQLAAKFGVIVNVSGDFVL